VKVAITGGTGFIGSHVVAAALAAGHEVRMLVRTPAKADRMRAMFGLTDDPGIELAVADMTDEAAMVAGLEGCDAVIHVAALFSLDPRQAEAMERVNPAAARTIVEAGRRLGLDPIVHVSTLSVFHPPPGPVISADLEPTTGVGPYSRSKIAAERIARAAQAEGAPVVTVYPGGVFGPRDPNDDLSDSVAVIRDIARWRLPSIPRDARMPFVDVRDVAAVCVGALEPGRGPRRYLIAGEPIELRDMVRLVASLTGRFMPILPAPTPVLRATGRIADAIAERTGRTMPVSKETVEFMIVGIEHPHVGYDQEAVHAEFGVPSRTLVDTTADTLRWLAEAGHLSRREIGRLADPG